MGLDVCVHEFVKIPDEVNTEKELNEFCKKTGMDFFELDADNPYDKKFPREYTKGILMEVYDWETTFKNLGLNYNDYKWVQTNYDTVSFVEKDVGYDAPPETWLTFNDSDIEMKKEYINIVLIGRELGYQRKGANAKFYEDGKWDENTWVITKEELIDDWNKYFSDPDDEYYGKEAREHFKENIIDNFEEGKTYVVYC